MLGRAPAPQFSQGEKEQLFSRKFPESDSQELHTLSGYGSDGASVISGDDTEDDFDWNAGSEDDDDNAEEEEGKKRGRGKRGRWMYYKCMSLPRPLRALIMTAVGVLICMIPVIVVQVAFESYSKRKDVVAWCSWFAIIWAAGCVTFVVVDVVAALLVRLALALYGRAPGWIKHWIEILIGVSLYVKIVLSVSWAWISLGGILGVTYSSVGNRPSYWHWVNSVLQAAFSGAIVLLVEKMIVQLVAIDFHATAVKDRLEENQKALKVLDTLYEATRSGPNFAKWKAHARNLGTPLRSRNASPSTPTLGSMGPTGTDPAGRAASPAPDSGATEAGGDATPTGTPSKHKHQHNVAGIGRAAGRGAKKGARAARQAAQRARKAKLASQLNEMANITSLSQRRLYKSKWASQESARKLAKKLFLRLGQNRKYLTPDDFIPFFKTSAEAHEAFDVFDHDGNGDIDRSEMRSAVQRIYRERRALNAGLKDISQAMSRLDNVLFCVALIIVIFLWLLIFNHSKNISSILPLTTFIVSFSFVFGNSLKNIFESMIFIFGTHPYDAGDLTQIDGNWMFVQEFGLLSTTFRTVLNETVVAPNSLLASSKYIYNARRSGNIWETTQVSVGYTTTPLATIELFRARLRQFVKDNDREYGGGLDVNFDQIHNQNAIALTIAFEHTRGAYQDWGARWSRRTKLMKYVRQVCHELGMQYESPPQPVRFAPTVPPNLRPSHGRSSNRASSAAGDAPLQGFAQRASQNSLRSGRAPFGHSAG